MRVGFVIDRENLRWQVFDLDGKYVAQVNGVNRPCDMAVAPNVSGVIGMHRVDHRPSVVLGSIDDAIGFIGRGRGISTQLGLLDAGGPVLARALATRGLSPRAACQRPLGSIAELEAWLDHGPLLMDGARWFGEGHCFVAIGCDQGGVYTRDSSGWDRRYVTWSRLYGEVGFSGWVVGVASC